MESAPRQPASRIRLTESEALIQQSLDALLKDRTTLVIARVNPLRYARPPAIEDGALLKVPVALEDETSVTLTFTHSD